MPDSVTQILASGPPGTKINIAVLGDGFAAGDQTDYNKKVKELLSKGSSATTTSTRTSRPSTSSGSTSMSNESGVSRRVYNETGTPSDPSDDTIVVDDDEGTPRSGYIYSGSWAHCWLEGGRQHVASVENALDTWVPD